MSQAELAAFEQAFHDHQSLDSNACVALGIDQRRGQLPARSAEAEAERDASAARLLQTLDALAPSEAGGSQGWSTDALLDLDLARLSLEAERFDRSYRFNDATTREQRPRAGDDIGEGLFLLSVADARPEPERLADVHQRVAGIPEYLDAALATVRRPVARWAAMEQEKLEGLPTLLQSLVARAEATGFPGAAALGAAAGKAVEALNDYSQKLKQLPTSQDFSVGEATAREIVRLRGIELSMEQLQRMARDFLAETAETLETLRGRLVASYGLTANATVDELHQALNARHRLASAPGGGFDHVLRRYEAEQERILGFIRERDLFPIPQAQQLKILQTPRFMEPSIPAGAMTPPAPFAAGDATSIIYLTLSEGLLDEHTELGIPMMMIHEGIPGHHLQLATAARHPSTIRRHISANDHAEGWTTLLEDYMLDAGYLQETVDAVRFCAKRELARMGARVAIDLYFMTGERDALDVGIPLPTGDADCFALAGALLERVTGFTPARVQAELNWYSQERGYPLSYLTGNRLATRLLQDTRVRLGDTTAEADRVFFRNYLELGNMPLSFLRRAFAERGLVAPSPHD